MQKVSRETITPTERLRRGLAVLAEREGAPARLLDEGFAEALMFLAALVLERNREINLTALTDPFEFVELNLLDSLAPVSLPMLENAETVIDVGSGAGFPGLPLALLYPEKSFVLTDALRKRTDFIAEASNTLGLKNVRAVHARAEALGKDKGFREKFDLALCRAVGALPIILEYALPLVKIGGSFVAYKTVQAKNEIEESLLARETLGAAAVVETFTYRDLLPDRGHALYIISKETSTPEKFPRREGVPAKIPL